MKMLMTAVMAGAICSCLSVTYADDNAGKTVAEGQGKAYLVSSNKLMGASIVNNEAENIGTVDSLLLNERGDAIYVVAGVGGVAGVGRTMIAVPVDAIRVQHLDDDSNAQWQLRLNMSQEKLSKAPPITTDDRHEFKDENWVKSNAEYFNSSSVKAKHNLNEITCVKTVTDADIHGKGDESVGHLDAILLNSKTLHAVYAIIGDGGTLGVNEKYFAIPFDRLRFTPGEDQTTVVSLPASKVAVHAAPQVTPEDYQELKDKAVLSRIEEFEGRREASKPVIKD